MSEREGPAFERVLSEHLPGDYTHLFYEDPGAVNPPVGCRCGWRHERGVSQQAHLAAALTAEHERWLAEWLGDEGTRAVVARAMSGPHWWAEDDNGIGDEIRQSIREDAAAALAVLTTHRHDGVREGGDHG